MHVNQLKYNYKYCETKIIKWWLNATNNDPWRIRNNVWRCVQKYISQFQKMLGDWPILYWHFGFWQWFTFYVWWLPSIYPQCNWRGSNSVNKNIENLVEYNAMFARQQFFVISTLIRNSTSNYVLKYAIRHTKFCTKLGTNFPNWT